MGEWPLGHGPSSSGDILGYANAGGVVSVDSYMITVLVEYGVFGFLAFFGLFLFASIRAAALGVRGQTPDHALMIPVSACLVAFLIIKTVLSQEQNHSLMFIILAFVIALSRDAKGDLAPRQLRSI
jgi:O-antigen ligase